MHIRLMVLLAAVSLATMTGCEEQQKKPAPKEKAAVNPIDAAGKAAGDIGKVIVDGTGQLIDGTGKVVIDGGGKVLSGAGKVVVDGGGKVLEGTGKLVIDGGGKVVAGAGEVAVGAGEAIVGAGFAVGKAVGDVIVVSFGPETKAEDFVLRDVDGREVRLSDYKGYAVVLVFCKTSYPPCVVEMKHLKTLQEKYGEDGLRVIAVALDWEGPAALRAFQRDMELNYPLVWDDGTVFKKYTSVMKVPTTFLIDRNGNIWKKRVGFRSAVIVTQGGQFAGTSFVEMEKGFEEDIVALLNK